MKDFIFDLQRFDSTFSGGSGTADNPYQISTVDDLKQLATDVNATTGDHYKGKYFKLTQDIDMSSVANFAGIGYQDVDEDADENQEKNYYFSGTFDGDGHTISNLTISKAENTKVGLFGNSNGTIKNLTLKDSNITGGGGDVGGIVGYNDKGTVENCSVIGVNVSGAYNDSVCIGGIVGTNGGTVKNCSVANAKISRAYSDGGGIVGYNSGTVENCSVADSKISGAGEDSSSIGGIVGSNNGGTVKICLIANNTVTGDSDVGDTVGYNSGTAEKFYYYGGNKAGFTRAYKITLPEDVTIAGATASDVVFKCGGNAYAPKDASVKITTSGTPKIGGNALNKNADGTYSYTIGDADVKIVTSTSLLDNLDKDSDGNYLIKSLDDLNTLASHVNDGNDCDGLKFKLTADIDAKTFTTAIGTGTNSFKGTFDGQNHTISNLGEVNLFGNVTGGTIKDFLVKDSTATAIFGSVSGATVSGVYCYNDSVLNDNNVKKIYTLTVSNGVTASGTKVTFGQTTYYVEGTASISNFGADKTIEIGGTSKSLESTDDGYTIDKLTLTGLTKSSSGKLWTVDDNNLAQYGEGYTGGASISSSNSRQIVFQPATVNSAEVELEGISTTDNMTPSSGVINIASDNFAGNVTIKSNTDYKFSLSGDFGSKTFTGTSNADTITNGGTNIGIYGLGGNDSITNSGSTVTIDAGAGNDSIVNSGKNVTIIASSGNDTIDGFSSTSKLQLGEGNDNYTTQLSADGNLIITYGDNKEKTVTILGVDSVTAEEYIAYNIIGVPVNNTFEIKFNNKKNEKSSTSATLLSGFTTVLDMTKYRNLKTVKPDKKLTNNVEIIGNNKANTITSGAGDDTINGGKGYDKINGGKGDDSISGGSGNDKLYGEDGDDSIDGGTGEDSVFGGNGNDTLSGGKGKDTLTGGKGADIFVYKKGDGHDVITDYTAGEDTVSLDSDFKARVEGKNVILKVESGTLTLEKTVGKKVTVNDETKIYRTEGKYNEDETELEFFSTFNGNFKASAYKNLDLEVLDASAVKNKAVSIIGNDKDNEITGGSKSDSLNGGKGNDSINGGNGNDTLIGGTGNDTLTGGKGINIFVYESGDDVITDFSGNSKIKLLNASATTDYEFSGNDLVLNFDSGSLTIQNYDGKAIKFLDADDNKSEYVFTENALYNEQRRGQLWFRAPPTLPTKKFSVLTARKSTVRILSETGTIIRLSATTSAIQSTAAKAPTNYGATAVRIRLYMTRATGTT